MHVSDYLAQGDAVPGKSPWLDFADVSIPSGEMIVVDPALYLDGLVVPVRPGLYHLQVVVLNESGYGTIVRLRAFSAMEFRLGERLGEVGVDFAQVGIGDYAQISRVSAAYATWDKAESILRVLDTVKPFGILPWELESGVEMPFVTSGYGDGCYDVFELLSGEARVGVEVDFLTGVE